MIWFLGEHSARCTLAEKSESTVTLKSMQRRNGPRELGYRTGLLTNLALHIPSTLCSTQSSLRTFALLLASRVGRGYKSKGLVFAQPSRDFCLKNIIVEPLSADVPIAPISRAPISRCTLTTVGGTFATICYWREFRIRLNISEHWPQGKPGIPQQKQLLRTAFERGTTSYWKGS